jgi:DNA-binding winged helix-turn-helix (wHTH) protein/tetratricopeptide (TPR) repeat protein
MKTNEVFEFGEFQVDASGRTVRRNETPLVLSRRSFDVLLCLVQNPGKVLSKEELIKNVWPDAFVDENSLMQSISVLRKALEEKPGQNSYIVTLPGRGYQFICPVKRVEPESDSGDPLADCGNGSTGPLLQEQTIRTSVIAEENDHSPLLLPKHRAVSRLTLVSITVVALLTGAAVSFGGYIAWKRFHRASPSLKVVITDFENATGDDPELDHVLNQALQIDLEQTPFLNILPRTRIRETLTEMQRKSDEPLTPSLAREICERNNAQAMLHGTVSKIGNKYLLMLNAESCISGKELAGYKAEVSSREEVFSELDTAAASVRKQLGESGASRERFQSSIAQATTSSLDALRDYTQARENFEHGDMKAAQDMLEQAVALDPHFATAYMSLGSSYYNQGDYAKAAVYFKKAFDLRGRTNERERLYIESVYYAYGLNDYEEGIRRLRQFLQIYPDTSGTWITLCNVYTQLGEYPQAIDAGEHALRLDPHSGVAPQVLARAYKRANRFAEAKAVADAAVADGRDRWGTHSILFQIAVAEHDAAKIKSEGEWGLTHQQINLSLEDLGFAAASGGRLREAVDDFSRARTESLRNGDTDFADSMLLNLASVLTEFDLPSRAAASLKQMKGDAGDPGDLVLISAETGDLAAAKHFVATAKPLDKGNTVKVYCDLPLVRAVLAMKSHKSSAAAALLEPARPYQLRDFRVPYLRALAETEAGMLDAAAQDYRLILSNQGVDPLSPQYSLSHLGLARVLSLQKKTDLARNEYRAFLDAWKNADSDLPLLIQAKQEYAKLNARASVKGL